ncbi:MAG: Bifunctional cbb3-type cytochrome c oxidase subunit [Ignavibacteria bacterium]|nr:Bifunctional cbb3-type cytochrome c oxidase subunit [Ignavibacteria bacterium]
MTNRYHSHSSDFSQPGSTIFYDNTIVKNFCYATIIWGIVGMLVGLLIAFQIYIPAWNFGIPYTVFSRLRPLHTNGVIFAFVGNCIFMGVYYSLQRLCKVRMYSDLLGKIHFWGWQLIIVAAAITLPLGITTGKEYAELEWPIDIAIAVVWVIFGINMFGTLIKRREQHLYVAIWFYIATWVTVAVLHIVNSIEIPVSLWKSYPVYAGVQDALVQWWYGHNAVAFFLTTPFLGLMYYFLPKAAERPVYSYRLSIIHFWTLIFIYIWAGPHHLLYSSLPDWAQSLGMVFSLMLIAPSWGGMINGLLTLRGAWDKVREDPILKFFVVAVTAYGMATLEGPILAIKSINALSHFTDWTIAHVHVGALGWNGCLTFAVLYWLVPRLFNTTLWSKKLANAHFWIAFIGILVYAIPLYIAGITQGLMWKQFTPDGMLKYPDFMVTVQQIIPMYIIRSIGGSLFFAGIILCGINLFKTIGKGSLIVNEEAPVSVMPHEEGKVKEKRLHRIFERKPMLLMVLALLAILVGTLIEIIPMFVIKTNVPTISSVKPYTPLELAGRDIYVSEGCYTCHSQMVRPFRSETARYKSEYAKAGEFVYDHPFQWGSKRTGPDLLREGGKYPNAWHYNHLLDPRITSEASIMPSFAWLANEDFDVSSIGARINAMLSLGVPYANNYADIAPKDYSVQADFIVSDLKNAGIDVAPNRKIIALIAYLQRLGTDIKVKRATGN